MDGSIESQKNSPALDVFPGGGEMAALMRSHDWSTTPLGPVENWSQSLRTLVSTMLASRFAQSIFWGEDYIQLYNDAVIPIYGATHPKALGQPARETWAEIWHDQVKPVFESVRTTGEAFFAADQLFHPARFGYLEETYFTICYSPVRDETGKVSGMLCTSTETTQQVIGQRRLTMLRELATAGSGAKTRLSACLAAADTLNPYDIPFALLYQVNGNLAERVALSGLPADSAAAPREINLTERSASWSLGDVLRSREPLLITDVVDRFGSLPVEPWGESPHSAFILPILSSNKEQVECLLVAGISPRLEFNAEYRSFLELVAQQVESSIATARSYEQERQRAEALAELDRAKTTFFNNISHEFRTPLTLMLSPLEDTLALPDDEPIANHRQSLAVVHRNGLRLLKLVNTLLDFSRIEAGRVQAVYKPTDLAEFTAELASVFRSAIERAGLTLIVDCPSDFSRQVEKDLTPQPHQEQGKGENSKPSQEQERGLERGFPESVSKDCSPLSEPVYVDRDMWEKIVLNLLSNAFKFTFAGQITVRLRQVNNQAELTVQDTGVGIPEAELPRLFERFHRVSSTRSRSYEGSGIGLSLVQELVKLHGGTIEVSSQVDVGTTFTVAIPLGETHLSSAHLWREAPKVSAATPTLQSTATDANIFVEEALRWLPEEGARDWGLGAREQERNRDCELGARAESSTSPQLLAPSPSSARILLVDDNADMRDYVQRLLSKRWQVKAVENGAVALALVQNWMPDLILSDVMMPELDGFGLLQAIRANPHTQEIPVILLSARAGEESEIEGLEAGADDYLIKPFSARELMTRVNTNLQMAHLRQERSANRLKDEFLATLTHELNAPLAAILAWARLLHAKPFDRTTTLHALEAIERNASNQAKLIEDLLDVSSILSGKRGLNPQPVDLVFIIDDVLNTLYPTAQKKAISLTACFAASAPCFPSGRYANANANALRYGIDDSGLDSDSPASQRIKSDEQLHNLKSKIQNPKFVVSGEPKRLRQIIANVLSNAIKFTPEGGKIAIQLGVERHEAGFTDTPTHARIQIKDTGIGISADFLPYVFDRFRQAEVPSRHSPGGVGIGLAIARHLVELHGGTIEVASEGEGCGATFTVRLPLMTSA
jgi:signal transduction histidine kinase